MPRGKWSPYEHGSRALCLAHWQGRILPRTTPALAMYCDIVPTLVDFAGGEDPLLDGKSLMGLWMEKEVKNHRDEVFISNVHPFWQKAIVTDTYKLIWTGHPEREHIWGNFNSKGKFFAKPWAEWMEKAKTNKTAARKMERILQPKTFELYDIVSDPYETKDLAAKGKHKQRIKTLHKKLKSLMAECGESTTPPQASDRNKKKNQTK